MSRIITFSRIFPSYHPKKGQPTYFVEKLIKSLDCDQYENAKNFIIKTTDLGIQAFYDLKPKHHTIRAGNRFKRGDYFSPRVWSGKPYNSKMITIAPDIEIKKIYEIEIKCDKDYIIINIDGWPFYEENKEFVTFHESFETLAKNDGLSLQDLKDWFKYPSDFEGQIICWNENIDY